MISKVVDSTDSKSINIWNGILEKFGSDFSLSGEDISRLFELHSIMNNLEHSIIYFHGLEFKNKKSYSDIATIVNDFFVKLGFRSTTHFNSLVKFHITDSGLNSSLHNFSRFFINENSICKFVLHVNIVEIMVYSFDKNKLYDIHKWILDNFKEKSYKDTLQIITTGRNGLEKRIVETSKTNLIKENYSKSVMKDWDSISRNIGSENPMGRLNILRGVPGCGKTFLLKSLIGEHKNASYINIMPDTLTRVPSPEIIRLMLDIENSKKSVNIIFVEDGDSLLISRKGGKNDEDVISKLLNMTDGFLSDALNLHFIITTNLDKMQIDEALTRKGRVHKIIDLEELSAKEANLAYSKMDYPEKDESFVFTEPTVLADIYSRARGLIDPIKKSTKIGFGR